MKNSIVRYSCGWMALGCLGLQTMLAGVSLGQGTTETIALSGEQAGDTPAGAVFNSFGNSTEVWRLQLRSDSTRKLNCDEILVGQRHFEFETS